MRLDLSHDKNINLKYNDVDNDEIEEIGGDSGDERRVIDKVGHSGAEIDLNADINFEVNDMEDEIKLKEGQHEGDFRSNTSSKNQHKLNIEVSNDNSSQKISHKSSKNQKNDFGIELGEVELKSDEIENKNDFTNTINYPNEEDLTDKEKRKMDSGVNLNFNVEMGSNSTLNANLNKVEDNKIPPVPIKLQNMPKEHKSPHSDHNDNQEHNLSNWDSPDHKQKSKHFEDDNLKMTDKIEMKTNDQQPSTFFNTELKVSGNIKKPDKKNCT